MLASNKAHLVDFQRKIDRPKLEFDSMSGRAKIPYLYITSASFSGSTLLSFLLNAHPQMVSLGEMGPIPTVEIDKYLCSCGSLLLQCKFFLELERRVNILGSSFNLKKWQTHFLYSPYRLLDILMVRPLRNSFLEGVRDTLVPFVPGYRKEIGQIARRVEHVVQSILEIRSKKVYVDAQKDPIRIKFLRDIERFDVHVIHLVRDVRGVVASVMKRSRVRHINQAARYWYNANMNSERSRRYVSSQQWLRIRYDDLCAEPQDTLDRISNFIGVQRAPIPKNFYESEHHIIGNPMRLKRSVGEVIKADSSWQDRFTNQELNTISRIGGAANRHFGADWP
jgi:sulfotransferase family protein